MTLSSPWRKVVLAVFVLLVAIQLVPYGHSHPNPPVVAEPKWDSPATRELAKRACFDCHSNETRWPWYSHFAPSSWLVRSDVDAGRQHMNFSEWQQPQKHAGDAAEQVRSGVMPLGNYLLMHRDARLTEAERNQLVQSLVKMFGDEGHEHERD